MQNRFFERYLIFYRVLRQAIYSIHPLAGPQWFETVRGLV